MQLDMLTVMIGHGLISAVCALVVVLLWRHARGRYAGLGYLAADYVLQLICILLIMLRGRIPDLISIVMANTLGLLAQCFLCGGLALFGGRAWRGRLELSAVGVYAVLFFWFTGPQPSLPARNILVASFLSFFCARAAWIALRGGRQGAGGSRLLVASLAGFILVNLLRLGNTFFGQPPHDFMADHTHDTIFVLAYSGLLVSTTFGIYLMVNRRLLADTVADFEGRVKAEAELLDSAGRLRLAMESAGMGSWQWDVRRDVRRFDDRTCELLGLDPAAFKGGAEEFFAVVHPEDVPGVKAALRRTLENGAPYQPEYRVLLPGGGVRHIASRGRLYRGEGGEPQRINGVLWDVTERRRAEAELRASEERFSKAFNSAPMLMSLSEIETGRFVEVNDKFCEVTGFTRPELIGRTSAETGWITAEAREKLISIAGGRNLRVPELELRARNGRAVVCSYTCERISMGGKDLLLAIAEDITAAKSAELAQRTAQRLESLGTLAGGIAHDFNNLLTGITGSLSLLKRTASGEDAEILREADAACRTAHGLARQLLTFASGGEPVKAPLDLGELAAQSVSFSLRGSRVKGVVSAAAGTCALGDREQLFQALNNLVMNAEQAMPSGGELNVASGRARLGEGEVPGLPAGEYCYISVRDQGRGMAPEQQERIFEPYFSTKGKGRGLGLSVCRSIVLKHGGQIRVSSEQGKGSEFTVYLPYSEARPEQQPPAAFVPGAAGGRVLVMEDEEIVYRALSRMLGGLGYEAHVTRRGEEALLAWKEAADTGRPFKAAIMDLTICGGMGGAEAVRHLKAMDPGARVIVSSGYSDAPVLADYAAHGFDASLSKPYRLEELAEVMGRLGR